MKVKYLTRKAPSKFNQFFVTFFYYARSVDPTILQAINEISRAYYEPIKDTDTKAPMLIDYYATYPNVVIQYYSSNIYFVLIKAHCTSLCRSPIVSILDIFILVVGLYHSQPNLPPK